MVMLKLLHLWGLTAPPKPTQRPEVAIDKHGVPMVTARTMTVLMPACFFSDENGPIQRVQVIVAEERGKTRTPAIPTF